MFGEFYRHDLRLSLFYINEYEISFLFNSSIVKSFYPSILLLFLSLSPQYHFHPLLFIFFILFKYEQVGRTTLDSRDELVLEDFSHVEKMSFPPSGNTKPGFITPPHPLAHTFKFKSYSLQVFRRIRTFFGIDNAEYMMSVCGTYLCQPI